MDEHCEPTKQVDSYEIYEDGPLTYFRCYVDEFAPQSHILPVAPPSSLHPFLSKPLAAGLVGAGLAATAVVGFAIAHHTGQDNGQEIKPVSKEQSPKSSLSNQQKAQPQLTLSASIPETIRPETTGGNPFSLVKKDNLLKPALGTVLPSSLSSIELLPQVSVSKQAAMPSERKPLAVSLPELLPIAPMVSSSSVKQKQTVAKAPTSIAPEKKPTVIVSKPVLSKPVLSKPVLSKPIVSKPVEAPAASKSDIASRKALPQTPAQTPPLVVSPATVKQPMLNATTQSNASQPNAPQPAIAGLVSTIAIQGKGAQKALNVSSSGSKSVLKAMGAASDASMLPTVSLDRPLISLDEESDLRLKALLQNAFSVSVSD